MREGFHTEHNRRLIKEAHREGIIDDDAYNRAIELLPAQTAWWWGIDKILLTLGVAQLLAGIIFFFAFNWDDLTQLHKFAILQGGLFLTVVSAWFKGFETLVGKTLLLSSTLILGVLIAVYGQTYQTGADNYVNFLNWALLALPLALLIRFTPLWILWCTVANLALILYFAQNNPASQAQFPLNFMTYTCSNGLIFVISKYFKQLNLPTSLLWLAVLFFASSPVFRWIVEMEFYSNGYLLSLFLWLAIAASGFYLFRLRKPVFNRYALLVLSAVTLAVTLLVRLVIEAGDGTGAFLGGIIIICGFAGTIIYLYYEHKQMGDLS